MSSPAGRIRFLVNKEKALSAVLFLINKRPHITQYDIVKTLFLADKQHLNRYGRPITFDTYIAMEHGPVPSFTYDMLKPGFDFKKDFDLDEKPWITIREGNRLEFVRACLAPHEKRLSQSDQNVLRETLIIICGLTFSQIKRITHDDPAYKEAWDRRGSLSAVPMKYELLLEETNEETLEELEYQASLQRETTNVQGRGNRRSRKQAGKEL